MLVKFTLLVLAPLALAITDYEQCKGKNPGVVPDKLFVRDCEETPCDFYNEDIMMAEADFRSRNYPSTSGFFLRPNAWLFPSIFSC